MANNRNSNKAEKAAKDSKPETEAEVVEQDPVNIEETDKEEAYDLKPEGDFVHEDHNEDVALGSSEHHETKDEDSPMQVIVPKSLEGQYSEEDRQKDLANVEALKELFAEKEELPAVVTNQTLFRPDPELAALAERFKHLSESEIEMVAAANSWSKEFRLEVLRNKFGEREIMHPPQSPFEVQLTIDKGHTV